MNDDETGLMLWGGIDLDLTVLSLRLRSCGVCGAPATAATRRLDQQERHFVCDAHRRTAAAPRKEARASRLEEEPGRKRESVRRQ